MNNNQSNKIIISDKHANFVELGGFIYIEGMFHMFLRNRSGAFWTIEHYTSQDTIVWKRGKVAAKSARKLGAGSVLLRGGKLYLTYKKGTIGGTVELAISKNHSDFEDVEVPVFEDKPLFVQYTSPRLIYSQNEYFILASQKSKENSIAVFGSQNGVLWEPRFDIKMEFKNKYPSIILLSGRCFLVVSSETEGAKYCEIKAEFFNRKVTFIGEWKSFGGVIMPRTAVLQDGRVILTAAIKCDNGLVLSTPRELSLIDDNIAMQPIKELCTRRGEQKVLVESREGIAMQSEGWSDIDIDCDISEGRQISLEFVTQSGSLNATITASCIKIGENSVALCSSVVRYIRVIVAGGRIEIFINEGASVVSSVMMQDIDEIKISGNYSKNGLMAYGINI